MYMKKKDWDVVNILTQLRSIHRQICNPYNDGWVASGCKHDLFQIKCLIEDLYADTPTFTVENEWHEKRLVELLKK